MSSNWLVSVAIDNTILGNDESLAPFVPLKVEILLKASSVRPANNRTIISEHNRIPI